MHVKRILIKFKGSGVAIAPVTWQQNKEAYIKKEEKSINARVYTRYLKIH